jgi:predicted porin
LVPINFSYFMEIYMKKSLIAFAALAAVAGVAQAQSVTLYGRLDAGIRQADNMNSSGQSSTAMTANTLGGNRFGIEGNEDLGSGTKAFFRLEGGFNPATGAGATAGKTTNNATPSSGALFDRQAFVGISSGWGSIKLGRDNTFAYDAIAAGVTDVTAGWLDGKGSDSTIVSMQSDQTLAFANGDLGTRRMNNAVKYVSPSFNGVTVGLAYGIGGQANDTNKNSTLNAQLAYAGGPLKASVDYQSNKDLNNAAASLTTAGVAYTVGQLTYQAGYMRYQADAAYRGISTSTSPTVSQTTTGLTGATGTANGSVNGTMRMFDLGVAYQVNPATRATVAYYSTNVNGANTGNISSIIAGVTYDLSKRTTLYAIYDHQNIGSNLLTANTWSTSQNGYTAGVRHMF